MIWSGSAAKRRRLAGLRGLLGPFECLAAVNAGRASSRTGARFAFDAQTCADRVRGEGVGAELFAFGPGGGVCKLLEPSGGDEVVALLEQLHRCFSGLVAHREVVERPVGLGEGAIIFASPVVDAHTRIEPRRAGLLAVGQSRVTGDVTDHDRAVLDPHHASSCSRRTASLRLV
ncbi:hypothetical protein ACFPRL_06740 [Pseudoclavibacter helvolus]